jgi:hypothetical protein
MAGISFHSVHFSCALPSTFSPISLVLSAQIQQTILIDEINACRPESIRLRKTRHIRIPHDILRSTPSPVHWPRRRLARNLLPYRPIPETVRIQIVHEARPGTTHQLAQVEVALWLVEERVDGVAKAVDVVEDEGDFLEVRDADFGRDAGGARVEAKAVGGHGGGGPGRAGQAPVGDEDFVASIGRGAAVFEA